MREPVQAESRGWLALLAVATLGGVVGILDLVNGVWYQAQDITGSTFEAIVAESQAGARLASFAVRLDGLTRIAFSVVVAVLAAVPFRRGRAWAWWTAWVLPVTTLGTSALHLAYGAVGPATTGAIIGVALVAILLWTAPRFLVTSR